MRHYDISCGPIYVVSTNEKGWRTRIRDQTPILSCSGVVMPLVKLQKVGTLLQKNRYKRSRDK